MQNRNGKHCFLATLKNGMEIYLFLVTVHSIWDNEQHSFPLHLTYYIFFVPQNFGGKKVASCRKLMAIFFAVCKAIECCCINI